MIRSIVLAVLLVAGCYSSHSATRDDPVAVVTAECGNGILELAEQCDDANPADWDGCNSCTISEFMVNIEVDGHQEFPAVVVSDTGRATFVWNSPAGPDDVREVRARFVDGSGELSGEETVLTSIRLREHFLPSGVTVASAPGGGFALGWLSFDLLGHRDVWIGRYDRSGLAPGPAVRVSSPDRDPFGGSPALSVAPDGTIHVLWESHAHDSGRHESVIESVALEVGDEPGGPPAIVAEGGAVGLVPDAASAADGGTVLVWQGLDAGVDSLTIYCQRFDAAGVPLGEVTRVNTASRIDNYSPAVDVADDGTHVVVWQGRYPDEDAWGIYGRLFDAEGRALGPEFLVNDTPTGSQSVPDVSMAGDGRFVVVWDSSGPGDRVYDIAVQRFEADGSRAGPEILANLFTTSLQIGPSVDMGTDGRFIVVWQSKEQLSAEREYNIYAQRFDAAGRPRGLMAW